jgi:ribonuclease HI
MKRAVLCSNHIHCQPDNPSEISSGLFNPEERYGPNPHLTHTEVGPGRYGPPITFLACGAGTRCCNCGSISAHLDELLIAVDGACRFNGRKDVTPRASYGVFVGKDSPYNDSGLLQTTYTNQVAELRAGLCGLLVAGDILVEMLGSDLEFSTVVIKSDSEYLVKGLTEWVAKWEQNGWKTAKGTDVANRSDFEDVLRAVEALEDNGVTVLFWHVKREFNGEADKLAKAALDN